MSRDMARSLRYTSVRSCVWSPEPHVNGYNPSPGKPGCLASLPHLASSRSERETVSEDKVVGFRGMTANGSLAPADTRKPGRGSRTVSDG